MTKRDLILIHTADESVKTRACTHLASLRNCDSATRTEPDRLWYDYKL